MSLEDKFSRLSLATDKYLVGFADTEGVPHRDEMNNIWNIAIIFKYVVTSDFSKIETIHNVAHFACQKKIHTKNTKKPLQTFFDNIEMMQSEYNTKYVYLCFWNAPHDAAVLKAFSPSYIRFIDLLKWARSLDETPKDFSINTMFGHVKGERELNALHTGLGDTKRMIKIYEKLGEKAKLSKKEQLKQIFDYTYNYKENRSCNRFKNETNIDAGGAGKCNYGKTSVRSRPTNTSDSQSTKYTSSPVAAAIARAIRRSKK